ncbi:MAG: hypothetical protein U0790_04530 [Isosphaeraceae bacterium]
MLGDLGASIPTVRWRCWPIPRGLDLPNWRHEQTPIAFSRPPPRRVEIELDLRVRLIGLRSGLLGVGPWPRGRTPSRRR